MRAIVLVALLSGVAACQPAAQSGQTAPDATTGAQAAAAPAAGACPLAGKWRVASEGGESTWVIAEDGSVTNEADSILRGRAELAGSQLSWTWEKGDWAGSHSMMLSADCKSATGSTQYTRVPRGRELGGTYSTTAVRVEN